ncbi:murein L,D-transpeptidase catalytic domain family protein [Dyadobacter sp. CY323]|uniref:murein L,D-transpeptidase catalytic domain family protein n=1 Tax=Dyadobacter sp. CY323 TaxID=2907302 RepID=UPI001F2119F8|nr:murein L,D-transpeptidase catalytic domain family protein [Dyadobacter sp. CY323]MCE6992204.1 murein L,D-transpeptidase catalytic domain family protein [Dyadobacter sp. CY323]
MTKAQSVFVAVIIALSVSIGVQQINPFSDFSKSKTIKTANSGFAKRDSISKPEWVSLYDSLNLKKQGLSEKAFYYAWYGFQKMKLHNPVMAIADFTQSSRNKRLYVIDLIKRKVLLNTYVAHGRNSGQEFAERFSNDNSSYQSSLGFYKTLGTYQGKHGLSLRLEGVEKGINDRALERAIVMHGADYVSESFIKNTGRLGRSLGCPAVSTTDCKKLINMMYDGAGLFIYSGDQKYVKASSLLAGIFPFADDQTFKAASLLYTSGK